MEGPSNLHQVICGELHAIFRDYIRRKKGECVPMVSPVDVQLDCDNHTMVQPDVLILCDRSKFKYGRIYGAPDLVVEILSKTTRKKDMFIKAAKYMKAGVREFWIVDPEQKRVISYLYGEEDVIEMYTFQDNIPVGIFDNQCIVNFAEIYEYVEFLYHVEK